MEAASEHISSVELKPLSRRRGCKPFCQVLGCSADLSEAKLYCQRKHLCQGHMQAEAVRLEACNSMYRFCFQCGKLQELACFDGLKRTCRQRLQKRRDSICGRKQAAPDCMQPESDLSLGAASGSSPSSPAAGEPQLPHGLPSFDCCSPDCSAAAACNCEQPLAVADISPCSTMGANSQLEAWSAAGIDRVAAAAAGLPCAAWQPAQQPSGTSVVSFLEPDLGLLSWGNAVQPSVLGCDSLLPRQSWESVGDAESLGLMLESELTAAALQAELASCSTQPLDPEAQLESRRLAAALVNDSGLFNEVPALFQVPAPLPMPQLFTQQSSNMSSLKAACAAATARDIPAAWQPCGPQAAPAYRAAYSGMACPAGAAAPWAFGSPVLLGGQSAVSCTASSSSMPGMALVPPAVPSTAPGMQYCVGQQPGQSLLAPVNRLTLLKQQMVMLQASMEMLRHQLGC